MADSVGQTSLLESKFVYFTGIFEIERESKCKEVLLKITGLVIYFFCSLFFFILPISDYLNHLYNKEVEVKIAAVLAEQKASLEAAELGRKKADLKALADLSAIKERAPKEMAPMEEQKALIEKGDELKKAVRELQDSLKGYQEARKHRREFEERMYKSGQVLNTILAVSALADCYR